LSFGAQLYAIGWRRGLAGAGGAAALIAAISRLRA